jgi:hypothetical protein
LTFICSVDHNESVVSRLEATSDLFSEAGGGPDGLEGLGEAAASACIEGLVLDPPLSEEDYVFGMTNEEGLDDLFLDQLIS